MNFLEKIGAHLPASASTFAPKVDSALDIIHMAMFLVFILWTIFFIVALIKFRKKNNVPADHNVNRWAVRSFLPDAAILVFEIYLIFALGLPIWSEIKEKFPAEESSNVVEMVAEQFSWQFQYAGPDGIMGRRDPKLMSGTSKLGLDKTDPNAVDDIESPVLYIPDNKPTILYMTSKDVIHNFFVPEFRVKQDVVPGMRIPMWFQPTKQGTFQIVCSQLCGLGHYRMVGTVVVLAQADFEAKLKEVKAEMEIPQ